MTPGKRVYGWAGRESGENIDDRAAWQAAIGGGAFGRAAGGTDRLGGRLGLGGLCSRGRQDGDQRLGLNLRRFDAGQRSLLLALGGGNLRCGGAKRGDVH